MISLGEKIFIPSENKEFIICNLYIGKVVLSDFNGTTLTMSEDMLMDIINSNIDNVEHYI